MATLLEIAQAHQRRLVAESGKTAAQVALLWGWMSSRSLEASWSAVAPEIERVVTAGQVTAAALATEYAARATRGQGDRSMVVPEAFGGVTREGRGVAPELYAGVTTTKSLIGRGMGVGQAFAAGSSLMSVMSSTLVRDAGRSADRTVSVGRGARFSIRVVSAGACSRCAILAGVRGYRADFQRHPGCRCTSMPLFENESPAGFFTSPDDYFESLSESEQERVFTKSGAEAIRAGADPVKVVNARRGALKSTKLPDGTYSRASLRPTVIGRRADGTPLTVYATPEGTTVRGAFGRTQTPDARRAGDRYRRTSTLRLMPEQIMQMSTDPERVRELLQRYGYLY